MLSHLGSLKLGTIYRGLVQHQALQLLGVVAGFMSVIATIFSAWYFSQPPSQTAAVPAASPPAHLADTTAPAPTLQRAGSDSSGREFFRQNLRRLLADSTPVLERFSSWDNDANTQSLKEVNDWVMGSSIWICRNMGRPATVFFLDPNHMPMVERFSSLLMGTKAWALLHVWRENLQAMIEKDTWDPPGGGPGGFASDCSWNERDALAAAFKWLEAQ